MFRGLFEGPGIWIVLIVVLLLFGATRLPALARSIGQSTKILRDEIKKPEDADDDATVVETTPAEAPASVKKAQAKAEAAPTKSAKAGKSGKPAKS